MADSNSVYDKDADETPVHHEVPKDSAIDRDALHTAESAGSSGEGDSGGEAGGSDKGGSSDDDGGNGGESGGGKDDGSLFNASGDSGGGSGKGGRGRFGKNKSKLKSLSKNKWLVGGAFGGGGFLVVLVLLLVLIAGSLKIPNLAEHITAYEFARVIRQAGETERRITFQKMAIDALDNKNFDKVKANYQNVRNNTWGKLDKYRPQKVIDNLTTNSNLRINYEGTKILNRQRLKSISLGSEEFQVKSQGYTKYIPGISNAIDFKNNVDFTKQFVPALNESLKAETVGPIIRGVTARQIRKELGIGLVAWHVGKYSGLSEDKAKLVLEREANSAIADKSGGAPLKSAALEEARQNGNQIAQNDLNSDASLTQTTDNGGTDPKEIAAVTEGVSGSKLKTALSFANPIFGTAVAGCIIYDGSLKSSGPTINSQTAAQQKTYYFVASAADQQKYGHANGEAVGATNAKLDDITQSNPEIRAAGGTVDTSSGFSSQASAGGDYTILDAVIGGAAATFFDGIAGSLCPTLTRTDVAIGGAVFLTALQIASGGSLTAIKEAVDVGIQKTISSISTRLLEKLVLQRISSSARKEARGKVAGILGDTTKSAIKVGGLTVLAKLIVLSRAGSMNTGLEQGKDFANQADSGGNIHANELEQRQFYGRPMMASEIVNNHKADVAFLSDQEKSKPAFDRYLALTNPQSLLNRTATLTASTVHMYSFRSFLSFSGKIFAPLGSMHGLFGSLVEPRALAAATYNSSKDDYGNVQFGYSAEETHLLQTDYSYGPLDNQKILDASAKETEINDTYHECLDGSKQIGDLLAEGKIVREENGNIKDDPGALCSPTNLSARNPKYGELVFRWRVAHNYDNGLDDLLDKQTVTKDNAAPSNPAVVDTGATVPADEQAVAKEILANPNITYIFSAKEDVQLAADGKPGTNGVPIDIRGLQLVDALGKNHKLIVSAYESHGQGHSAGSDHYTGHAVDIAKIDGQLAFTNITAFYSEFSQYAKNATFLQGDCPGTQAAPPGMNRQPGDSCTHQHISLN